MKNDFSCEIYQLGQLGYDEWLVNQGGCGYNLQTFRTKIIEVSKRVLLI